MDALSDALRVMGLTGGLFLEASFSAPWCVAAKIGPEQCRPYLSTPTHVIGFHFVVEGHCWVQVENEPVCEVAAGDVVLFPHNGPHRMGSDLAIQAVPVSQLLQPDEGTALRKISHGGGGAPTQLICGFLGGEALLNPLLESLPPTLKITLADIPGGDWIARSFTYAAAGLADGSAGTATVMSKMSELLFVETLRHFLAKEPPERTGWLAGLRDPAVARALSLMHSHPQRNWTTEDLADQVHLSRSAFAERFSALLGQPPMRYLTLWRMQLAARSLRDGRLPIAQIAFDCGYESEATFNRAFKREFGTPPSAWRKSVSNGETTAGSKLEPTGVRR